jgi:hypothetical protein
VELKLIAPERLVAERVEAEDPAALFKLAERGIEDDVVESRELGAVGRHGPMPGTRTVGAECDRGEDESDTKNGSEANRELLHGEPPLY